jgi:hypothetical protein
MTGAAVGRISAGAYGGNSDANQINWLAQVIQIVTTIYNKFVLNDLKIGDFLQGV